jgi:hypothetical protein
VHERSFPGAGTAPALAADPCSMRVAEGAAREETFMVEDDFGPWDD